MTLEIKMKQRVNKIHEQKFENENDGNTRKQELSEINEEAQNVKKNSIRNEDEEQDIQSRPHEQEEQQSSDTVIATKDEPKEVGQITEPSQNMPTTDQNDSNKASAPIEQPQNKLTNVDEQTFPTDQNTTPTIMPSSSTLLQSSAEITQKQPSHHENPLSDEHVDANKDTASTSDVTTTNKKENEEKEKPRVRKINDKNNHGNMETNMGLIPYKCVVKRSIIVKIDGPFVIYEILFTTSSGTQWSKYFRYSELASIHQLLVAKGKKPHSPPLPDFAPKKIFFVFTNFERIC